MRAVGKGIGRFVLTGLLFGAGVVTASATELGVVKGFYATSGDATAAQFPFLNHKQAGVDYGTRNHSGSTSSPDDLDCSKIPAGDPLPKEGYWYYMLRGGGGTPPSFTWTNLTANAAYRVYLYTYEGYYDHAGRKFYAQFNGTRATTCQFNGAAHDGLMVPFTDAGKKDAPCRYEFEVTSDADGKIAVALENSSDNAQFTSAVLLGSSVPGEPTSPSVVRQPGDAGNLVSWNEARDALAYYVERSTDGQTTWETVGQAIGASLLAPPIAASGDIYYRVVASNGVGVTRSPATLVPAAAVKSVRYAFNFGLVDKLVGRFVPAQTDYFAGHTFAYDAVVTGTVPTDYQGDLAAIYKTFVISRNQNYPFTVTFTGLTPGAEYDLRWHSIESTDTSVGQRVAAAYVNGTKASEDFDVRDVTGGKGIPAYLDFKGTADADGVIKLEIISSNADRRAIVCALELFEREDATKLATPSLQVVGSDDMIRLMPDNRHAQFAYDIQYADAEPAPGAAGTTLVTGVSVTGFADLQVAANATRWYRARATFAGLTSDWTGWISATRSGRSAYAPLRLYCYSSRLTDLENQGWTWDQPYRVDPLTYSATDRRDAAEVYDLSGVENPAPTNVYRLYMAESNGNKGTNYVHVFSGFDPSVTYRVRLHVLETFFTNEKARYWDEEIHGVCDTTSSFNNVDPYRMAGKTFRAAVAERDVKPDLFGKFKLEAVYINQYAQYRGIEFVPLNAPTGRGSCQTAIYAKTGDTLATVEDSVLVAERAEPSLVWNADTLPAEAADSPRIDSHGFLYAPCVDDYTFTFAATGRVRLWIDGKFIRQCTGTAGTPVAFEPVALTAGVHEYHLDYTPTTAATCAFSATWSNVSQGSLGSLGDYLMTWDSPIGLPAEWRLFALGAETLPPPFAFRRGDCVRLYGSGSDIYGARDEGTILFRKAKRGFRMRMHVKDVGGENVHGTSTRFGLEMRSSLDTPANYGFAMYSGFSTDGTFRSYADTIVNNVCNMINNVDPWQGIAIAGFKPPYPIYLDATRERLGGGNWRYVFSYSKNGVDAAFARTQEIAKATSVYVGPTVCAYTKNTEVQHQGEVLAWMDIDELILEEDPAPGLTVIVR